MRAVAARGHTRLHPTRSVESASAYLAAKRGGDEADAVLRHAAVCASVLRRGTKFLANDARRATRLAEKLLGYVQEDAAATRVLHRLIDRWRQPTRPGAPVANETLFVRLMQLWAERERKRPLRPTELMAAAVASGLVRPAEDWRPVLDRWRKRPRATPPVNDLLRELASAADPGSNFWKRMLEPTKHVAADVAATSTHAAEEMLIARDLRHLLGEIRTSESDGLLPAD